jgi:hypothetical protein
METAVNEGIERMDCSEKKPLPQMWAFAQEHLQACLICGKRKLAFVGAFKPGAGTQSLWFADVRPQMMRLRMFALCSRCFKTAKRTKMENVDRHFRQQLRAEHGGLIH